MPDITSSMKEDKKGPKNREITLGLGYSKNTVRTVRQLIEFMKVYEYKRSRSFLDLHSRPFMYEN